jgi:hypothetical protein
MANASDFLEVELRKHIFRTGSFTKPTILGVALYTAAPSDAGGGTEVTGGSYARVNVPPLDANWTGASSTDGITTNAADITFPTPSANWGTVTHFGIFDNTTAGNLLVWGPLSSSRTINNGDPAPKFLAGQLSITIA